MVKNVQSVSGELSAMLVEGTCVEPTFPRLAFVTLLMPAQIGLHRDPAVLSLERSGYRRRRRIFWEVSVAPGWESDQRC